MKRLIDNCRSAAFLLILLAVLLFTPPANAAVPLTRSVITAVEVYRVNPPETLGADAVKVDGAGNRFDGVVHFNGNDTAIWVDKYDRAGALVGSWAVAAPPAGEIDKYDSASLSASGTDLFVGGVSHLLNTRGYVRSLGVIPGVYVPFSSAGPQEDGAGAYQPTETTTTCPTASEIAAATYALLQPYILAQIQRAIDNEKPKARAAIDEAFQGGTGSYQVWSQLSSTAYQGAMNALRDYRTPTPHP
jgi:hypothetical protein